MIENLNAAEALNRFAEARAAMDAYMGAQPDWVQWWVRWMEVVLAPSLLIGFLRVEARIIAAALIYGMLFAIVLVAAVGPSDLWGLAHLLFWTPAAIYCSLRLAGMATWRNWYPVWLLVATATMWVSLAFDLVDVLAFFLK